MLNKANTESIRQIKDLVNKFETHKKQYKKSTYDEANTRVDFIDPFFETIGWDVANRQGFAEQYREVIREDKIIIVGKHKAPDYSFRIGGIKKFFVEAKKPSVDLKHEISPAYQVRRYAYTAKLPLSILTDFEEFAVYDTRIKPTPKDSASVARIFYCNYQEYLKNLDFIVDTFSKEAILKGSFDKYVESTKKKRGTSEVDKEFLKLIDTWREKLARNIALRNKDLTLYELNFSVQKIIDRIIFLRIAEDRQIDNYGTLQILLNGENTYRRLTQIFLQSDDKYNSGLFDFKTDTITLNLTIDDKILKQIIKSVYYPDSPYEFSVLDVEILGNIYEQFLGKTIRLTPSHMVKVEEKPEVKKAGGVYYTPKYIVDYIVRNTVNKVIKRKSPKQIEKIKILDPACGSGSFLLGAYQHLIDYHLDWYTKEENRKRALRQEKIVQFGKDSFNLTIAEKQRILTNNIFGVDIDRQAVAVSKLSLLLKLLEGETHESTGRLFSYTQLRLLPDLSNNIKCGNSLIGTDYFEGKITATIDEDEIRKINPFNWKKEFPEIFRQGGFDVVIGNPPYVNAKILVELFERERKYLNDSKNYSTLYQKWDLYICFIEKGLKILKQKGLISMIIPYPFINQMYAKMLRRHIIDNYNLVEIADLSNEKIFKNAIVTNCIFVVSKRKKLRNVIISSIENGKIKKITTKSYPELILDKETFVWDLEGNKRALVNKHNFKTLGDFCFISIGMVLNADEKKAKGKFKKEELISSEKSNIHIKRYVEAKDIDRYGIGRIRWLEWNTSRVPRLIRRPTFPELYEKPKIMITKIGDLQSTFDKDKLYCDQTIRIAILWKNLKGIKNKSINNSVKRFYSESREILEKNSELMDYKYLLGIINSKIGNYLLNQIRGKGNIDINPQYLKKIPIPTIVFSNPKEKKIHDDLVAMVDRMLKLQKKYHSARFEQDKKLFKTQIDLLDQKIDSLVYKLYNLIPEEIKIVENSIKKSPIL